MWFWIQLGGFLKWWLKWCLKNVLTSLPPPPLYLIVVRVLSKSHHSHRLTGLPQSLFIRFKFLLRSACLAGISLQYLKASTRVVAIDSHLVYSYLCPTWRHVSSCFDLYHTTLSIHLSTLFWISKSPFQPHIDQMAYHCLFSRRSTLLCIQSVGQISRFIAEARDESYSFLFLILSAAIYVGSAYFLIDSYSYSARESMSATLIGVSVTSVGFLSGIAISNRKGNVVETSLMMAYLSYNIYCAYPSLCNLTLVDWVMQCSYDWF